MSKQKHAERLLESDEEVHYGMGNQRVADLDRYLQPPAAVWIRPESEPLNIERKVQVFESRSKPGRMSPPEIALRIPRMSIALLSFSNTGGTSPEVL